MYQKYQQEGADKRLKLEYEFEKKWLETILKQNKN